MVAQKRKQKFHWYQEFYCFVSFVLCELLLPSMMALYRIPPWISCSDLTCHIWQWNDFNTVWVSVLHFIRHMSVSNKYVFGYLLDSTWHTLWDTTKTIFRNCVISILYKILPRMSGHCLAFSVPQSNLLETRLMWPWWLMILEEDLTDATLLSDNVFYRLDWCDSGDWGCLLETWLMWLW